MIKNVVPIGTMITDVTHPNWHRMVLPQSSPHMKTSKARGTESLTTLDTILQHINHDFTNYNTRSHNHHTANSYGSASVVTT